MIEYRYEEERQFALFFANELSDERVLTILKTGEARNADEARRLSQFFWRMVDKSIEMEKSGATFPWEENVEYWTGKLYNSLGGYLERSGYEDIWSEEVDKA